MTPHDLKSIGRSAAAMLLIVGMLVVFELDDGWLQARRDARAPQPAPSGRPMIEDHRP